MHLAFCLFKYFPYGGLQKDFLLILNECLQRGHTVDIYAMQWVGDIPSGCTLKLLKVKGWSNHRRCASFSTKLQQHLRSTHYDAVIGFNKMAGLDIYYAADICLKNKLRDRNLFYQRLGRYKTYLQLERTVFEGSSHILFLNKSQQCSYQECFTLNSEKLHCLPPGIAKSNFSIDQKNTLKELIRTKYSLAKDAFMILMVGSHFATKGLDRALIAVAALPQELKARAKLFVVGQGKAKPFHRQAQKLKICDQVIFLGPRSDVKDFMLAADLLLHPSYYESGGKVLLEALTQGLPVLTTQNCGYAEHISHANAGMVIPAPFSQVRLNEALEFMLTNNSSQNWQQNAVVYAELNDLYSMPQQAAAIIETLCYNLQT